MLDSVRYSPDYQRALKVLAAGGGRRLDCGCVVRIYGQIYEDGPYSFTFAAKCAEADRIEKLWPGEKYTEQRYWARQDHVCCHVTPWYAAWTNDQ